MKANGIRVHDLDADPSNSMNHQPSSSSRLDQTLAGIVARPALFALVLLALRLVAYPYAGLIHDAMLYAAQVQNQASGQSLQADLFFQFGSQDGYSVFSRAAAPLAAALGVPTVFLLFYIASCALFLYAQVRVVRRIVVDPRIAVLAMVVLAVGEQAYGGWGVFTLHEPFLTPRLPACALVLLAIDRAMDRSWAWAVTFVALATALHPLMALAGAAYLAAQRLSDVAWTHRSGLTTASALALSAGLGFVWLMTRQWMDPRWLGLVRQVSPHCFLSEWRLADWIHLSIAVASVLAAWRYVPGEARRLLGLVLLISLAGLAAAAVAEVWPVAILVQAQPMRALWTLHLVAVPAALLAAAHKIGDPAILNRVFALALVFWALGLRRLEHFANALFWLVFAACGGLAYLVVRALRPRSSPFDWTPAAVAMVFGAAAGTLAEAAPFLASRGALSEFSDPVAAAAFALRAGGTAFVLVAAAMLLAAILAGARSPRAAALRSLAVAFVAGAAGYWLHVHIVQPPGAEAVPHARVLIAEAGGGERRPTVYWPTDVRNVWFGLGTPSYLSFAQMQGIVFSRETAMEAARRIEATRPFELARGAGDRILRSAWRRLERVFGPLDFVQPPTVADLIAVSRDPRVDYVLFEDRIPGVEARRCGPLWLYDCADLRMRAARADAGGNP
jgi:hypothetical protein